MLVNYQIAVTNRGTSKRQKGEEKDQRAGCPSHLMRVSFWNIRGLNDPVKHGSLMDHKRKYKIDIMCILETRVRQNKENVVRSRWKNWRFVGNGDLATNARIWLSWKPDRNLIVIHRTFQYRHCSIAIEGVGPVYLIVVYASSSATERTNLGEVLQHINVNGSPWCLIGNFNAVSQPCEVHQLREEVRADRSMEDFKSLLLDLHLTDHAAQGCYFAWSNKRVEGFQCRKLDHVVVNEAWLGIPPSSAVGFVELGISDHSPAIIKFYPQENLGPKLFKFFYIWIEEDAFLSLVNESWANEVSGNLIQKLHKRLKALKGSLRQHFKHQQEKKQARRFNNYWELITQRKCKLKKFIPEPNDSFEVIQNSN